MFHNEGFLCILAPQPPKDQETVYQSKFQPIHLLSTADNSPIVLAKGSEDLVRPLISKLKCVIEENCAVANRQLSESVSCNGVFVSNHC